MTPTQTKHSQYSRWRSYTIKFELGRIEYENER